MCSFNFAGIKGSGPSGDSFVAWTREVTANPEQRTRETFRAYPSAESGAYDYVRLLSSRYPVAFRAAARGDVVRFVRALDLGGYFTDSDRAYSRALASLARECRERSVARRALEVVARGAVVAAASEAAPL
jgi:flagellum-specific peptidoglycan hydrolase FlgJ